RTGGNNAVDRSLRRAATSNSALRAHAGTARHVRRGETAGRPASPGRRTIAPAAGATPARRWERRPPSSRRTVAAAPAATAVPPRPPRRRPGQAHEALRATTLPPWRSAPANRQIVAASARRDAREYPTTACADPPLNPAGTVRGAFLGARAQCRL